MFSLTWEATQSHSALKMAKKNSVIIDDSVFQHKIRKLARKLKIDEYDFVKDQGGLLAREVAKMTPPYAKGKFPSVKKGSSVGSAKDIKAGEWAIYNDIKKICIIKKDMTARETRKLAVAIRKGGPIYGKGNRVIARGVIKNASEYHAWHKANKRSRGRTRKLVVPNLPWVTEYVLEEYAKTQIKSAGLAKAAFWKASLGLRAKSPAPAGIKRHKAKAKGTGRMIRTNRGPAALISGSEDGLAHVFRHIPALQTNRLKKAKKRLEYISREAAKKADFKVV